jgi:hypothetical protein
LSTSPVVIVTSLSPEAAGAAVAHHQQVDRAAGFGEHLAA